MQTSSGSPQMRPQGLARYVPTIMAFLALVVVNLVSNFSMASQFGIYEDDYLGIVSSFSMTWGELVQRLHHDLISWPQGRPFFWSLLDLSSWVAAHTGGISQFYLFGLAMTSAAALSIYVLLSKFFTRPIALIAAVFFVVYPPDAAKQVIMHQFSCYLATMLVVIAFISYLNGKKVLPLLLGAVVLLTFEPYFLLLPCAVLLSLSFSPKRRIAWRPIISWGFSLFAILLIVFSVRKLMGEGRVTSLLSNPFEALTNGIFAMLIGPATMLHIIAARIAEGFLHGTGLQWAAAAGVGIILWMASSLLASSAGQSSPGLKRRGWIALAAGVAIVLPYAYRFIPDYYPPNVTIGRLSMLHQVSALGCALGLAWIIDSCITFLPRMKLTWLIIGSAFTISCVPFALENQETQYVRNAHQQSLFWKSLLSQIGDVKEGMPIIFDFDSCLDASDELGTEGFNVYWLINYPVRTLPFLVSLPAGWKETPHIFAYSKTTPQWAQGQTLAIQSSIFSTVADPVLLRNNGFIFFKWRGGRLVRSIEPIGTKEVSVAPYAPAANFETTYPLTPLGQRLLRTDKHFWAPLLPSFAYPSR